MGWDLGATEPDGCWDTDRGHKLRSIPRSPYTTKGAVPGRISSPHPIMFPSRTDGIYLAMGGRGPAIRLGWPIWVMKPVVS